MRFRESKVLPRMLRHVLILLALDLELGRWGRCMDDWLLGKGSPTASMASPLAADVGQTVAQVAASLWRRLDDYAYSFEDRGWEPFTGTLSLRIYSKIQPACPAGMAPMNQEVMV